MAGKKKQTLNKSQLYFSEVLQKRLLFRLVFRNLREAFSPGVVVFTQKKVSLFSTSQSSVAVIVIGLQCSPPPSSRLLNPRCTEPELEGSQSTEPSMHRATDPQFWELLTKPFALSLSLKLKLSALPPSTGERCFVILWSAVLFSFLVVLVSIVNCFFIGGFFQQIFQRHYKHL